MSEFLGFLFMLGLVLWAVVMLIALFPGTFLLLLILTGTAALVLYFPVIGVSPGSNGIGSPGVSPDTRSSASRRKRVSTLQIADTRSSASRRKRVSTVQIAATI